MTVVSRLYHRYKQFGGIRLIWEYVQLGAFTEFVHQGANVLCGRKEMADAYATIQGKVIPKLKKQYQSLLNELVEKYAAQPLEHQNRKRIWVCWLQGMEQAPEIVRVCHSSLKRCFQ